MSWYKYSDGTTLIGWILVGLGGGIITLGILILWIFILEGKWIF